MKAAHQIDGLELHINTLVDQLTKHSLLGCSRLSLTPGTTYTKENYV